MREEIFGPVAAAIKFKDEGDAVFQGNDTTYGLAAAVWTKDLSRAHKIARSPKAGTDQRLWPDRSDVAVRQVQAIGLWP